MTKLSHIFTKYVFIILFVVIMVVVLSANIGSRIFFQNFMMQNRYEQDAVIMQSVREILYGHYTFNMRMYSLSMLARQSATDIVIELDGETLFNTGQEYVDSDEVIEYTKYEVEDLDVYIGRIQNVLLEEVNREFINTLNLLYLLMFLFAILASWGISMVISKRLTEPIAKISQNIQYIGLSQYDKIQNPSTKAQELVELSKELEDMATHKKNEEAMRQRLSNDIVHELKTPITTLVANLEAIQDGIYKADEERVGILLEQTNRLAKLVQRLSHLTIIETEKDKVKMEKVDLSELIQQVMRVYEPEVMERNIALQSNIDEHLFVWGNKDHLTQVFINLLSNGVKYTEENGWIKVNVYQKNQYIITEIQDNGIGIDDKDLPYIFERFYRSDESRSTKTGGAGIGLAIVKAIVTVHEGQVKIESKKDKGTKVTVLFKKYTKSA